MEPGQVATDRVCVGAVRGSFGVRGEVRLASFTAEPDAIGGYGELEAEDGNRLFSIESLRPIKGGFAARMAGVACREEAAALKGTKLFVARDRLPVPGSDEYYWADLEGSKAFDRDGARIGTVAGVHNFGAGDLLEIAFDDGGANEYVPFTHEDVPKVHEGRVVLAGWPRPEGETVVAGPAGGGPAGE